MPYKKLTRYTACRISAILLAAVMLLVVGTINPCQSFSASNSPPGGNSVPAGGTSGTYGSTDAYYFSDVPENHWARTYIYKLRELNITQGIGNNKFGLGLTLKRSEFVAFLVRLMQWDLIYPEEGTFDDNKERGTWYFPYIETALKNGAIINDSPYFRPDDPITREEIAIMIVRALGYDKLAQLLSGLDSYFEDVHRNTGYITIARDLEIIKGVSDRIFNPDNTALREEAAAMMIRLYEKLNHSFEELHAFYAISSSSQADLIKYLDSVSFGWSKLEYDMQNKQVVLNTTVKNNNEFYFPNKYEIPLNTATGNNIPALLMVHLANEAIPVTASGENDAAKDTATLILGTSDTRKQVIEMIAEKIKTHSFTGVTIDFEYMKGPILKNLFNVFLEELKAVLDESGKKLYVAVHPPVMSSQEYFDAYDFKTIGEIADRIILMAHDYNAKRLSDQDMETGYAITPLTPIYEVYYALKAITHKDTGIEDRSKILLQVSFDSAQWKMRDGKIINRDAYRPDYTRIKNRLIDKNTNILYLPVYENPYAKFTDSSDGTDNLLWYEDARSISAKIKLARLFGIGGISIWRLGNIPDFNTPEDIDVYMNVWQVITEAF